MNPSLERAARSVLDDWRREARGSRSSAAWYEEQAQGIEARAHDEAVRIFQDAETAAADARENAAEHRKDADRAEEAAREIEVALLAEGVDPNPKAILR